MKRLFLAIDITPGAALTDAFDNVRHTLRMEKINWVRKDQMHLTLAFLGDTEEDIIPDMVAEIETAVTSYPSFKLTLAGLGIFRNIHDPRVIWVGCEAEKELHRIKVDTDKVLSSFGFETEDRPFSPHLTLGRIKFLRQPNHLSQLIGMYKDTVFQSENIRQVVLFESRLTTDGPEYIPVFVFPLGV